MKKVISLLLVLTMVFPFIACADTDAKNPPDTTVSSKDTAETTAPSIIYEEDALPDNLDFGGEKVFILSHDGTGSAFFMPEISVDELTSEVINDSIYNRERFVEDRLGVEIENIKASDTMSELEKQLNSGEDTHHIVGLSVIATSHVCMDNYFLDLKEVEHLDLEKPWWSDLFNDEAELMDELYFTTGSLALSLMRNMYVVYYNKSLAEDYVNSTPELADLYSIVDSGKWTFDKWINLSEGIYKDLNGNTERDAEDLYGIGYVKTTISEAFFSSFDIDVLSRTDDGWFELNVNTDKLYTALEKMNNLFYRVDGCFAPSVDNCDLDDMEELFASGSILFMVNEMRSAETETLRNMQDEYGILPFPKYDENQNGYYTMSNEHMTFAIPSTNANPEIAGAVLEAMASYSYRDTVPAYLDIALKGKYMNDPGSRRMIDTIVAGFKVDASKIYFSTLAQEYTAGYRYMLMEDDTAFASKHASQSNSVKRSLKAYKLQFEKNKEA